MTKRKAKRMACTLAADLLHADNSQDSWLTERISHLPKEDQDRVIDGIWDLVEELTRRGENL